MTGSKTPAREKLHTRSGSWPVVTVVCLVLMALLTVVQVAHLHATESDADHCPLCIAMHSAAPVAATAAIVVLVHVGAPTPQAEPRSIVRRRQTKLFIRPPPAGC